MWGFLLLVGDGEIERGGRGGDKEMGRWGEFLTLNS
jgi:hypothetical protein